MTIVVYGASGLTGSLVAEALARRGLPVAVSGRDRARLEPVAEAIGGAPVRPAPVQDATALAAAFDDARVVVQCAGPLADVGEPVVRAAVAAGAHYLDVAVEQAFVRDIYERYESVARRGGITLVSGLGVDAAVADWAAAAAAHRLGGVADEVMIAYALRGFHPARGARASAVEALAAPMCEWRGRRWESTTPGASTRPLAFPAPFGAQVGASVPSAAVITVPRHVDAAAVRSYVAVAPSSPAARLATRVASLLSPALPAVSDVLAGYGRAAAAGGPQAPTIEERTGSELAVVAEVRRGFERARVAVAGTDAYAVTAETVAIGAAALWDRPAGGLLAPAELVDAEDALAELARRCGVRVERGQ
jgi:short subunit dehydrogenase-like uncharacterized protein